MTVSWGAEVFFSPNVGSVFLFFLTLAPLGGVPAEGFFFS